jgi:hypothetical protein
LVFAFYITIFRFKVVKPYIADFIVLSLIKGE